MRPAPAKQLFLTILPRAARRAFDALSEAPSLLKNGWYLAGGTALALRVGHRQSVDLDFFTQRAAFGETALERKLLAAGRWTTTFREEGTIYGTFHNAKVSFIAYPFFIPMQPFIAHGALRIASERDVAVMKIIALSQRGRKRDFADLYWYCKNREPLAEVIARVPVQYPGQKHNMPHFIKSLTYFDDAEHDPMPKLFFNVGWGSIKRFFRAEAPRVAQELLRLNA